VLVGAALKTDGGAAGRAPVLALAEAGGAVVGAVNADFFSLTAPTGVPTSAHVHRGTVIAGPGPRPVFAVGTDGRPFLGVLRASGGAATGRDTIELAAWNRGSRGVALFDKQWGPQTDSAPARTFVRLRGAERRAGRRGLGGGGRRAGLRRLAPIGAGEWCSRPERTRPVPRAGAAPRAAPGADSRASWLRMDAGAAARGRRRAPMLVRAGVRRDVDTAATPLSRAEPAHGRGARPGGRRLSSSRSTAGNRITASASRCATSRS
jgi:hypothetical protein